MNIINKPVVLVAEDNPLIRMGAVELVRSVGYEALQAPGVDEAVRVLEARSDIDLVFTDVQMPGTMDGIELGHLILERWPLIKLIVTSGMLIPEEGDEPASRLPRGSLFFAKPYNDQAIAAAMDQLLAEDGCC
jgi:two-component system, response regulator PdtaR